MKGSKKESATYQEMLNEVELIAKELESGQVGLDELVGKVEHGYQLIKSMRTRLEETKGKVETLRDQYNTAP